MRKQAMKPWKSNDGYRKEYISSSGLWSGLIRVALKRVYVNLKKQCNNSGQTRGKDGIAMSIQMEKL